MKEIVAELDYQPVDDDWALQPVFTVPRDKPKDRVQVTVHLYHTHTAGKQEHCGLVNREEFLSGEFPEYECNKCAAEAPREVIEEKLLAVSRYKGYDPRNNRRAAVLATKRKGK
jgi:hypothetical protein